jgi:hypothetical protein
MLGIKVCIGMLMAAGLSFAQGGATPVRVFVISPNGHVQFVALDPSTLAVVNGVLTGIAPAAKLPARIVEITQVAVATPTYTLGQAPNATAPELDVFWNGLALSVGVDYTVVSNVVSFVNPPGPGDVLRVVYRGTS